MTPLRVLHIEDSPDDSELLAIQLRRSGFRATLRRVETAEEMTRALAEGPFDVVLADHSLPTFDAPQALQMLRDGGVDLPFIVFSGTISQALAIELMRSGAHDFVSKNDAGRLEPVVRRELREAENRRARRRAELEREETIVQLEAANRAKDEFLAMLGHELRNPLAPIVTALQLMKLRGDGRPTREHDIIDRQVRHMLRLVDDLLDVAKITRGKIELRRQRIEIAEAIARGVEIASPLLEQRMHRFSVAVPTRGLVVEGDEARLAQVVANLLTNAARYTRPGGDIALTAAAVAGEMVLRVKDNGSGIAPELLPRIFELFVQGTRTLDRTEGGLGLGLSLVRNLVEMHGGSVAALSEGIDRGSEFIVRLPLVAGTAAEAPAPASTVRAVPRHATPALKVLLVDDNRDAVEMLGEVMRLEGHEVATAHDGPEALALLDGFTPTVIVLDIGLPVMDGYEIARQIRARTEHRQTTMIALTGYGQASDRERSLDAGFDLHMVKPIDVAQLLLAVHTLTEGAAAPA